MISNRSTCDPSLSPVSSNEGGSLTISVTSSDAPMDGGEYKCLIEGIDDAEIPLSPSVEMELQRTLSELIFEPGKLEDSSAAVYGEPLSSEEADNLLPFGDGGLTWYATVIPDEFFQNGKLKKGLNRRDFNIEKQELKARRPSLPITSTDFFRSITTINGPNGMRYVFSGILNGWPALRCFEVLAIEERRSGSTLFPSTVELMSGHIQNMLWRKIWDVSDRSGPPNIPNSHSVYRAKLRGAPWTGQGWSKDSPGFAFWYESQLPHKPFTFGTNMTTSLGVEKCSRIHMISHRYAVQRESTRDRLTYHSLCFLEWEHGLYGTVVEAAYLNGLGGYKGLCNWFDDKEDKRDTTEVYKAMPSEMIQPWLTTRAEIRAFDVKAKNLLEFRAYIDKYTGSTKRFLDPHYTFSHDARLTFRSKQQLAQYFINYISRDSSYADLKRNCQTFAADLCAFIAGKKDIAPFHPVNRIDYQNRVHYFLYEPTMYLSQSEKKKKKELTPQKGYPVW